MLAVTSPQDQGLAQRLPLCSQSLRPRAPRPLSTLGVPARCAHFDSGFNEIKPEAQGPAGVFLTVSTNLRGL